MTNGDDRGWPTDQELMTCMREILRAWAWPGRDSTGDQDGSANRKQLLLDVCGAVRKYSRARVVVATGQQSVRVADFEPVGIYAELVEQLERYIKERQENAPITEAPERICAWLQRRLRSSDEVMTDDEGKWWDDLLVKLELDPIDGLPRDDWSRALGPRTKAAQILADYLPKFEPEWRMRLRGHAGRDALMKASRVCENALASAAEPNPDPECAAIALGFELATRCVARERNEESETLSLMARLCGHFVPVVKRALRRIRPHEPERECATIILKSEYWSAMNPEVAPEEIRVLENGRAVACHRHCDIEYPALIALQADYGIELRSDEEPRRRVETGGKTRAQRPSNLKRRK